ncbi:glycosyltransferase family 2 protein [Pectobacterium aroidearum]|uniref:glycosyltransferase family 2 protein n=1 Tax=Pectobacterium aroidearum TaxID=1201031 RepID=UPI0021BE1E53|nr:glycosyltransferase family 2 protein [Pectobacterium aroidearum]UXK02508.1 glycosyltransferase family 2 protein [Pectobacterium aroidearum]
MRMKNEAENLPFFIDSLKRQEFPLDYEVVFLDSGSDDDSIKICQESLIPHRIYSIDSSEFNFSTTCNLLTEYSQSDYCILLSAHVEIIGKNFFHCLRDLIYKDINLAYFRQVVNHNCGYNMYEAINLKRRFPSLQESPSLKYTNAHRKGHSFSNAGSMYKRDIAINNPFPVVMASEDFLWAESIISLGHALHYIPDVMIAHSHNESYEKITARVRVNKISRFGVKPKPIHALIKFILIISCLVMSGENVKVAYNTAKSHAKGYI